MKIGIDIMGGDNAPIETVKGAIESLKLISENGSLVLFGKKHLIETELEKYSFDKSRVEIVHCDEVVENDDKPVKAIKSKPNSSLVIALKALRHREIDALVSAGNTGALLAGGLLKVGRIKGINRPAIVTIYPTMSKPSVLVDAGANAECKKTNLLEFALMGREYSKILTGNDNPSVGLINIGAEETKGTPLQIETYKLLSKSNINFCGNIEGRDIPYGKADVLVTDGFTGNIVLKLTEGVAMSLVSQLKSMFMSGIFSKIAALLLKKELSAFKKKLDYTEYGGAPILGIDGLVIKAHGSSNSKAFSNAIKYASIGLEKGLLEKIRESIKEHGESLDETDET